MQGNSCSRTSAMSSTMVIIAHRISAAEAKQPFRQYSFPSGTPSYDRTLFAEVSCAFGKRAWKGRRERVA